MKIKTKILLYFVGTIFVASVVFLIASGFASVYIIQNSVGKYNAIIATESVNAIDRIIDRKIERWESYIQSNQDLVDALNISNQEFAMMSNRDEYIASKDKAWQSQDPNSLNPFMSDIIDNSISNGLRDRTSYYNKKYKYDMFPEMMVTNKYGVNIAQTGRTSDFNQADEEWWKNAEKDGIYVGQIEYDESSKTEALPICIRINDSSGSFVGVIKVVYNFEDIYATILDYKTVKGDTSKNTHESLPSTQIYLVDNDSKLIHSTNENLETGQDFSSLNNLMIQENQRGKNYFINKSYFNQKSLIAFASSDGYLNFKGLGWKIVIVNKTSEIFASVTQLGIMLVVIFFICLATGIIVGLYLSRKISNPISKIEEDMKVYSDGDLEHRSEINTKDEIGAISNAFNQLTLKVKQSRSEVDKKVLEQTGEIVEKQRDMQDQQKAILNILEDIEAEKEVTALEKDKISSILQSIGDGVFVVDKDLRIIIFNKVASELSGYEIKDAIGKKYSEILKFVFEEDGKTNDQFIKQAMETGQIKEMANHTMLVGRDGSKIAVADSAAPIKDKNGKKIGCIVVFRDVTKDRQIDKAKTEFVSLASHQLRTPLSSVNWYAEMLIDGDAGKLTKEQKEYVEQIYRGNKRMVDLVNALLNVSRIELGTFSVEPELTDVVEMSRSVISEQKEQIEKKKLLVKDEYEEIPKINVDPKLFRMVLQNYVSNAIKYTAEKGKVLVKISLQKNGEVSGHKVKKDSILVEVSDSGYGIPENQKKQIFTKLFRADNVREKETEGTGLGLYIVKSIAENADGEVWLKSTENKGSTFYFLMPLDGMKKKTGTKKLE